MHKKIFVEKHRKRKRIDGKDTHAVKKFDRASVNPDQTQIKALKRWVSYCISSRISGSKACLSSFVLCVFHICVSLKTVVQKVFRSAKSIYWIVLVFAEFFNKLMVRSFIWVVKVNSSFANPVFYTGETEFFEDLSMGVNMGTLVIFLIALFWLFQIYKY